MAVKDWSTTAASNAAIDGINIAEGCPPSNINNAIRALMASVVEGDFGSGTVHFDNITESTADAGVTIEAVLLKDGGITVGSVTASGVVGAAETSFVLIPVGTTAQRGSPSDGALRRNSTDSRLEYYDGSAWNQLQGYDADTLFADTSDTLTVGFNATEHDAGTQTTGTFTPDPADGNFQKAVNGGAHTLAPPGSTCSICIQYTNNASAGAITTSGFTQTTGDTISTTDGDDFLFFVTRNNSFSHLHVVALQ